MSVSTEFKVELGARSYPIVIGVGALNSANIGQFVEGNRVCIVSNDTVAPIYLQALTEQLQDKTVDQIILPDGEQYKSLDSLKQIFDHLISAGHDRKTTLIALGGGVVGDITGFAAASYQRGVAFIQVPTTLLSQVDSSVGGKTAVNHPLGKNMIGAFYQPRAVVIDTNSLSTLAAREFAAGMAEVVKYGLISDGDFFCWLEENYTALLQREEEALIYAIETSCRNKAAVVAADETEQGLRAILNLGHTFGHAIETWQNYCGLLHGEAVAVGMVMAAELSAQLGYIDSEDVQRTRALLQALQLPVVPPTGMQADDFVQLMMRDKKVLDGQLRLVLLERIGKAIISPDTPSKILQKTLQGACA